jgi:DNA-binding MarR family transcriptional regulator
MLPAASAIILLKGTPNIKEKPNTMVNPELESVNLRVVRMVYQTYTRFQNSLDEILRVQGLTTERYLLLLGIRNHDAPVRIVDIARWSERSPNSVTMLVDRMVKAGLLRRVRDRTDRRQVNVFMTGKAEGLLTPANMAALEFLREIMSPLTREDADTLVSLFGRINYKLLEHLNPGADIGQILKNDSDVHDRLVKRTLR